MLIPHRLKKLERDERGRCWLADLPRLVAELTREWDLELGTAYEGASVSYVAPVARGAERRACTRPTLCSPGMGMAP